MKVFLSHPSRLKPVVKKLRSKFPPFLKTWLDEEELCWSDNLRISLREAIQVQSSFVIVLLDEEALTSEWVRRELQWGLEQEKIGRSMVLPILVGEIDPSKLLPAVNRRVQLRLKDLSARSVSALAAQIPERLFQLIVAQFDLRESIGVVGGLVALLDKAQKLSSGIPRAKMWRGFLIQDRPAPKTPRVIPASLSLNKVGNVHAAYRGVMTYSIGSEPQTEEARLDLRFISVVERSIIGHYVNCSTMRHILVP